MSTVTTNLSKKSKVQYLRLEIGILISDLNKFLYLMQDRVPLIFLPERENILARNPTVLT